MLGRVITIAEVTTTLSFSITKCKNRSTIFSGYCIDTDLTSADFCIAINQPRSMSASYIKCRPCAAMQRAITGQFSSVRYVFLAEKKKISSSCKMWTLRRKKPEMIRSCDVKELNENQSFSKAAVDLGIAPKHARRNEWTVKLKRKFFQVGFPRKIWVCVAFDHPLIIYFQETEVLE